MRTKLLALLLLALGLASPARAQSLTATSIYLGTTGCAIRTGAGAPTGGASCDYWIDTSSGHVWTNHGGTWIDISTRTPTFASVIATSSVSTPSLTAAANLSIAPVGDLLLAPGGHDVMPGAPYSVNLGALESKYLTLHAAELWVETLVAQKTMATIGGRVLIAPTNILAADLPAGATNITVKYNNLLRGEIVYLEANARLEFMQIVSDETGAGPYTYGVTRNLDGTGADAWSAGDALLDTGTPGKGFIDLYSVSGILSGAGPTIVGNVRTGPNYNDIAPRFAVGNLDGLYGHGANQYGFAAGNPLGAYVYLDDANGLVMGGPSGVSVQITPSGNAAFAGTVTAAAGNIAGWDITANAIQKQTGALYSGMNSGASNVRFFAGATAAAGIDAAPFRVYADGSVVMSSAVITAPNAGSGGAALNADANTRDVALWAGCAAPGCASTNIGDGVAGAWSLRVTGAQQGPEETRRIPFDPNKTYRFHVWARAGGGANGLLYAGLSAFDPVGTGCDVNGCPSPGARYAYCANGVPAASLAAWTEYVCTYGAGSGYPVPGAMRSVSVQALLNWGGSAGWMELQDIRLEEVAPSTLIKDGAITTAKITAGAVTVGQINASGFGDNLIKNGAFEPNQGESTGSGIGSSALSGWALTSDQNTATPPVNSCCGMLGPGTLLLQADAATYVGMSYLAAPIERLGVKYRISLRVYSGLASPGLYVLVNEYNGNVSGVRRVRRGAGAAMPDVSQTSETILAGCAPLATGWNTVEYLYTPPVDTTWISLSIYNASANTICGGPYTAMHFDDVEMQKQIGTGHISANAITANLIQAGAITADKIAAGVITADKLAAESITAAQIAAGAIGADELQAGAVTAGKIAAGSITADRLNVTALSAITANLGAVTAGSISAVAISGGTIDGTTIRGVTISASSSITGSTVEGSTIYAGGGREVTLDGNGLSLAAGTSNGTARIKLGGIELWGGAGNVWSNGGLDVGGIRAHGAVNFEQGGTLTGNYSITGTLALGGVQGDLNVNGNVYTTNGSLFLRTNGTSLVWQNSALPPIGSGGLFVLDSTCLCLARQSSSVRYKENLRAWSAPDPLAILALPLYRFDFKDEPGIIRARDHVGFTVEDLEKLAPDAVVRDSQGRPESFFSDTLETYLLAALKAVNARVSRLDTLTARSSSVETLTARIAELEKKIAALEAAAKKKD